MHPRHLQGLRIVLLALAAFARLNAGEAPHRARIPLFRGWLIRSAAEAKEAGEVLSSRDVSTKGWVPTSVPSTVLAALLIQLAALRAPGGEEVLPVLWDANYLSLLPGESREVRATFESDDLRGIEPALEVGGWNVRAPFVCRSLDVSRSAASPGERVLVTARAAKKFLDGSRVPVLVDGKAQGSIMAWARGDATEELVFSVAPGDTGEHEIRVGSVTRTVKVKR